MKSTYKITRDVYKVDATDQILGRFASDIAIHLIGKHKPNWQKHVDSGDVVEVSNVGKIALSGQKIDQKVYHRHSGFPGGIKEMPLRKAFEKNPSWVLKMAVSRMLPKNKHRTERLKRLKIS